MSERPTQMEVFPIKVYQSHDIKSFDYNRRFVEGYAYYEPTNPKYILFIHVELIDGEWMPKKDPISDMYTYVLCEADSEIWEKSFGTSKYPDVYGVNFWFKQLPVDDMIAHMHDVA